MVDAPTVPVNVHETLFVQPEYENKVHQAKTFLHFAL